MQVSVETTQGLERKMTVEIPREKVDTEIKTRLKSLAGQVKLAGFRPGKVPMSEIKRRYGGRVEQEVIGEMVRNSFYEAVSQENLRPAGLPQIQPKTENEGQETNNIEFVATFEIYPDIQINTLDQIKVEKPALEINVQDIDKMVETIRKQSKRWIPVERASQSGDRVTIDFDGKVNGETFKGGSGKDLSIEIGSKRMIPGFEEALIDVNVDDEKVFSLNFPAEYHVKELAGKPVEFQTKIKKIETAELPELNDEFAASFGVTEGGLEAFRNQVKENMLREAEQKIKGIVKQQILDGLVAQIPVELPKVLIDNEIEALQRQRRASLGVKEGEPIPAMENSAFEEQARRRMALGLILSEIVKQNQIKVEPAKLRQAVEAIAASYERPEDVVKYYYSEKQHLAEVENLVLEDSAVEWVISQATVNNKPVSFDDLMNPAPSVS